MPPLLVLFLAGCAPHDAEMTGNWVTWLAANSSDSVGLKKLDLSGADQIDCSGRVEGDDGYLTTSDPALCEKVAALQYNTWLQDDGYYRMKGSLDSPWRTDAVMTSEGDFQLTVHQDLNSGEDFRFAFAIKPDFAPVTCMADANGDPEIAYVDGANWLDTWSEDETGYKIYYLNAGADQINPGDSNDYWYFTTDWDAGFSAAKFSADNLSSMPTAYDWTDPLAEIPVTNSVTHETACKPNGATRLFYWESYYTSCETLPSGDAANIAADIASDIKSRTPSWTTEMTDVYGAPSFDFKVEDNSWRTPDSARQGLDGWVDLNTSWVRVKDGADLEVGGHAEGDFQIVYRASDSDSYAMVTGKFNVAKIGKDAWGYPDLEDQLRDQNGTPFCGGAAMP